MGKFQDLRHKARLSRQACADYLGVNLSTVNRWDNDRVKAPFAVQELLRVISGELPDLSLRSCFVGWRFREDFLITPEGEKYTAEDIREIRLLRSMINTLEVEVKKLNKQIIDLTPDGKPIQQTNVLKFPNRRIG